MEKTSNSYPCLLYSCLNTTWLCNSLGDRILTGNVDGARGTVRVLCLRPAPILFWLFTSSAPTHGQCTLNTHLPSTLTHIPIPALSSTGVQTPSTPYSIHMITCKNSDAVGCGVHGITRRSWKNTQVLEVGAGKATEAEISRVSGIQSRV